jgi:hypothetical protein
MLHHSNYTWRRVQVMERLIMQFSPTTSAAFGYKIALFSRRNLGTVNTKCRDRGLAAAILCCYRASQRAATHECGYQRGKIEEIQSKTCFPTTVPRISHEFTSGGTRVSAQEAYLWGQFQCQAGSLTANGPLRCSDSHWPLRSVYGICSHFESYHKIKVGHQTGHVCRHLCNVETIVSQRKDIIPKIKVVW